jgi:hypothetical protein
LDKIIFNEWDFKDILDSMNLIIKMDVNFYAKLRGVITKSCYEVFIMAKEDLNIALSAGEGFETISEDTEMINTMVYNRIINHLLKSLHRLKDAFINQLEDSLDDSLAQKKEVIVGNYKGELEEIYSIIQEEANKTILAQVTKTINEKVTQCNIEAFETSLAMLRQILGTKFTQLDKAERDFVTAFYEIKEKKLYESIECESWSYETHNIPENYQLMINFIEKNNFIDIKKTLDRESITKLYDDGMIYTNEDKTNSLLEIGGNKYKLFMLTTLEVIRLAYETTKIYLYLDSDNGTLAIKSFIRVLSGFIRLNNDTVLESKEYKTPVVPKKVAIVCSNVNMARGIISSFTRYDVESIDTYTEVLQLTTNVLTLAKSKFSHDYFPQR